MTKQVTQRITYTAYTQTCREVQHSGIIQSIETRSDEEQIVTYVDRDQVTHRINILSPHFYNVVIK